jgi:tetratricopeptide (TPR) repeat protein
MDKLRQGTPDADRQAREIFRQAAEIDPDYSRAYAGISLSYFNDWSCQLWEAYEATQEKAYEFASKAVRLDDADYIVHLILGRILIYRQQFDLAEQHLDRSLALNPNDADSLVQICASKAFLGKGEEAEALFLKAMRLNPYRNIWYNPYGALAYFVQRRHRACIETALKGPLTDVWVDLSAYLAAACAHAGDRQQAGHYLKLFIDAFRTKITFGQEPTAEQIIAWMTTANPFRKAEDRRHLVQGLILAGLDPAGGAVPEAGLPEAPAPPAETETVNRFSRDGDGWEMSYRGASVRLSDLKGFHDLARLLSDPGREIHCTELMGNVSAGVTDDTVIDSKARRSYEQRIRDLKEEIEEAESRNDLARAQRFREELEQLTEHLARALGLGNRLRKTGGPAERARAAVTSRIRSAIRKIEAAHAELGRHLANSVRTGTFCSYTPEQKTRWQV